MANIKYRVFKTEKGVPMELTTLIAAGIVSAVLYKGEYFIARYGVNKTALRRIARCLDGK